MSKPSEYKISEMWDKCAENFFVRSGTGLFLGGALSIVFFRGGMSRMAVTGLATGFGAGVSFMECRLAFEHPEYKLTPFSFKKFTLPTLPVKKD
mmetsp:Transcript_16137/g.24347  ORF Transcript_16137/g.24347 Transcript_16137/m.24347 type:complete len:94 (+) Transcript_16137:528-809(+)|eukprot:CAMPEP_0167741962 /NCGR_PEP_ID=MMETSP0110_2-20121227/1153_1 /TAXON_ID=629695 /ORGANISM="Gymnochlora sp., Strain CCMP2014" /LENGTH=93 /DNA_ID=CAMNT_0007626083 /DNA_START=514 /DNA_END=795 /DNA_ORIENTATION=-